MKVVSKYILIDLVTKTMGIVNRTYKPLPFIFIGIKGVRELRIGWIKLVW